MSRTIEVPRYALYEDVRVDPARTALVVIDMQNDFVHKGGSLLVPDAEAAIPTINELLELARTHGMRVVYSQEPTATATPSRRSGRPRSCGQLGLGDRRRTRAGGGRDRPSQGPLRRLLRHAA